MNSSSETRNTLKTLKTLLPYLWPKNKGDLHLRVILSLGALLAAKIINVYVPFLLKKSLDALSYREIALILPLGLILAYGLARIMAQLFGELRDFLFAKVGQYAQRSIALKTFQHLHSLSLSFHLDRQTGGLSRAIERGTRGIQFVLNFMLFNIIPTFFEIIFVTVILLYRFNIQFAAITFSTILLYILYTLAITNWRLQFRRTMNQKDSEANTKAIDSLLNYETVKYFGNETHEYQRFDQSLAGYEKAAVKSQTSLSLLNVGQGTIIGIGLVLVMLLAGQGVVSGKLTVGDFVMVNTFLIQLYLPLNFLGFVYREMRQSLVDIDKMFELLEINAEIKDSSDAKPLQISQGEVVFQKVFFGYSPDRVILKGIDLRVPAGKKIAIVGPSGAGKSTISRLLFRFYEINSGQILIDQQDIRQVTQSSLRQAIGIVPQDTVLFNDTIYYNISYGRPGATEEEVYQAARLAKTDDFIKALPMGYQTMVGERGLKLSGGEKQRVAIARTLLKNPSILLFDEATSALDSQTEKAILESLQEISKNKTTLVIAHRLSTIMDADEILVLKNGIFVEKGNHHQLLQKNGEYALLWRRQQEARQYEEQLKKVTGHE